MFAVAVDDCSVPARGEVCTVWKVPFSAKTKRVSTVPGGIPLAWIDTGTGELLLMITSGVWKLPEGTVGKAVPAMLTTWMETGTVGMKSAPGAL